MSIPLSILAQALPKLVHREDREGVIVEQLGSLGFGCVSKTTDSESSSGSGDEEVEVLSGIEHGVVEEGSDSSEDSDVEVLGEIEDIVVEENSGSSGDSEVEILGEIEYRGNFIDLT